jgi:hypothetical protein
MDSISNLGRLLGARPLYDFFCYPSERMNFVRTKRILTGLPDDRKNFSFIFHISFDICHLSPGAWWRTAEVLPPVSLFYFSLPHFSLGKKSKRKMWERKIRIAQAGAELPQVFH